MVVYPPTLSRELEGSQSLLLCYAFPGLANSCYDLRFTRPQKASIATRMMQIAAKEGLNMEKNAIEMIVESVGNDIRQVGCMNTFVMSTRPILLDDLTFPFVTGQSGGPVYALFRF